MCSNSAAQQISKKKLKGNIKDEVILKNIIMIGPTEWAKQRLPGEWRVWLMLLLLRLRLLNLLRLVMLDAMWIPLLGTCRNFDQNRKSGKNENGRG